MSSSNNNNDKNITWHNQSVSRDQRWQLKGHAGAVLWFTGLSGAGKSTIANQVEVLLNERGIHTYLLDGDNIRHGLSSDLGFSIQDRTENIRRVGHAAQLMADAGLVVLAALISPYRQERDQVRKTVVEKEQAFIEIHVQASLETCEGRDPKGLYQLARQGKIQQFTGIDDPYEAPVHPELVLESTQKTVLELAQETVDYLQDKKLLQRQEE
jgi:adenylyl-sulfate kinase